MKRTMALILLALTVVLSLGCGNSSGKRKLFIYNWTYYIPDEVVREFEKKFNVRVVYDMYASNEEMFAKLKAGGRGYDIVVPSEDYVSIMIRENMLETIDKSRIPNLSHLDISLFAGLRYDTAGLYSVPYMMGCAGIAVNKKFVPEFERSWSIFSRPDLKGRMTMLDDMREVLGAALVSRGYSVNTTDPAQLEEAKQVVMTWRDNITKFDSESFGKGFAAGEFWVVQGYAENIFLELDSSMHKDVEFFIPREGGPMYMDNMVILNGAANKDLAYEFINFIHEPDVYARIADFLMLPSINIGARTVRTATPNYEAHDLAVCQIKEDLGSTLEIYNRIWQEIRVGR